MTFNRKEFPTADDVELDRIIADQEDADRRAAEFAKMHDAVERQFMTQRLERSPDGEMLWVSTCDRCGIDIRQRSHAPITEIEWLHRVRAHIEDHARDMAKGE